MTPRRICRVLALLALMPAAAAPAGARLRLVGDFSGFVREAGAAGAWLSPEYAAPLPFREVVVSWNAPGMVAAEFEVAVRPGGRWWRLGRWTGGDGAGYRTSINGQSDAAGRVDTDTLSLTEDAAGYRLRVRFPGATNTPSDLRLVAVSTWSPGETMEAAAPTETTPPVIEVPRRTQADFPEGVAKWCSPTSTSMLLAHWASVLGRPEIDAGVRAVAAGVYDPGWSGTGNWAFNTAFAGSRPGLRACVARLGGIEDLRALLGAGIPVAVSVSYDMLKGGPEATAGDGHLVVLCGFADDGAAVVNDPGVRMERVRRVFPRRDFLRGWSASHRTAYLVWPEDRPLPPSPTGTW